LEIWNSAVTHKKIQVSNMFVSSKLVIFKYLLGDGKKVKEKTNT